MRRSLLIVVCAVFAAALYLVAPAAAAADPPLDLPRSPRGLKAPVALPSSLDAVPRYQPQTSCQPLEQVGARKLADLIMSTYEAGYAGRITGPCTEGISEHAEGRAFDWMLDPNNDRDVAAAADFLAWATANDGRNARRLGIMYLIYNAKIWGAYRSSDGWRPSSGHYDHIHISLTWNGARMDTSFWRGKTMPMDYGACPVFEGEYAVPAGSRTRQPCPRAIALVRSTSRPVLAFGAAGQDVQDARRLLGMSAGTFDWDLRQKIRSYQAANDLPATGVMDRPTWASLDPGSIRSDYLRGRTRTAASQQAARYESQGNLSRGDAGKDVILLQYALYMPTRNLTGVYGAQTEARVKRAQRGLGRPATGVWTQGDWFALLRR